MAVQILDPNYLALTAIVTVAFQLLGFAIAYTCQFDKITDFSGAANFILLAVLTLILGEAYHPRQVTLTVALIVSRLWIGGFLLYRVLLRGHDARFDEMRSKFWSFLGFWVFQMLWVWLVSLPVVYVNSLSQEPDFPTAADIAGVAMIAVGIIFETGADIYKFRFKLGPESRGRHPTGCFFAVSRHPNYFGEILIWWGTFVAASSTFVSGNELGFISLLSPIFSMLILLFLSGIPSGEGQAQTKYMKTPALAKEYRDYRARTPPLIPFPPVCYAAMPRFLRQLLCCEFPFYEWDEMPDEASDTETKLFDPASKEKAGGSAAAPSAAKDAADGKEQVPETYGTATA